ncbi:unnamed protein product [Cuscuta epithymum]|uniref:Protein kinase domain-containing protein n=1 Tax=Cuscuta epithymum TaxID=186058 RepID=A0AAV0CP09_9ASTE|nr:unnamed protein product [Cuscuta epithymum]
MGDRLAVHGTHVFYIVLSALVFGTRGHCSLNSEGIALMKFQERVDYDPYGVFLNWSADDCDPCMWPGVLCLDGRVQTLDLTGYALEGTLAPELGNLTHMKTLVLSKNRFSGVIPREIGQLKMLEVLDLRDNSLNGKIPAEIGALHSLRSLLLSNNGFHGGIPLEIGKLRMLTELQLDMNHTTAFSGGAGFINRKLGQCWSSLKKMDLSLTPIKEMLMRYLDLFSIYNFGEGILHTTSNHSEDDQSTGSPCLNVMARRKLVEQSSNLAAAPIHGEVQLDNITPQLVSRSSGSFPAVQGKKVKSPLPAAPPSPNKKKHSKSNPIVLHEQLGNQDSGGSQNTWKYVVGISCGVFLFILAMVIIYIWRTRAARTIGPWKTGLSGQLQKAFITGVPKLNRAELEAACEDFSNIICANDALTCYKGTLSSKGEIAVVSTTITSLKDWSKRAEMTFRKKIDTLSRINHKNFINLIGYCEEDEPFTRMMVFEYAPNGTLSEHLHDKELEHLDWNVRMRIVMGIAYCLQHMHNLNPPLSHPDITCSNILLTDDYAAKIAEVEFWAEFTNKSKVGDNEEHSDLPPPAEPEANIYSFGLALLEIISGKLPYSEEQGPILQWASSYLNDKQKMAELIDPTLESHKDNQLLVVCEVIQECTEKDTRKRPTIDEVVSKLKEVIHVSPAAAGPRFSPLWWAELDIFSSGHHENLQM